MAPTKDDDRTSRTKDDIRQSPPRGAREHRSARGTSRTKDDIRQWPWKAQFAALLIVLALATFLIVLPVLVVRVLDTEYAFSSETDIWAAMIAILLGLTTMTVSGVFVFMTFRIDRGARLEARETATKEAKKAMKEYGRNVVDGLHEKLQDQFDDSKRKIDKLYSSVMTDVAEVADKAKTDVAKVAKRTKEDVSQFADTVKTDVTKVADTVKTDVAQLADKVEVNVSRLADASVKVVETQVKESDQRITEKFDDGVREIGKLFETAWEKAQAAIEGTGETPDDGAGGSNEG